MKPSLLAREDRRDGYLCLNQLDDSGAFAHTLFRLAEIAKSYKLGFAALRYYADSQRASLLLAKNDGRLWLLLKGLAIVEMPMEIREKIVDFAFFGKDAPERKANKAVEHKSEEEEEDEEEEGENDGGGGLGGGRGRLLELG